MPIPKTSSPILPARVLMKDLVYDTISNAILSGELAPGASLTDTWVAEAYGGTRASVRAALRRLANEGLVVVRPQVGTRVREVTPARTRDALALYRGITETTAIMITAELEDADLRQLRDRAAGIRQAAPGAPSLAAVDAFYDVLLARAGNRVLQNFHTQVAAHLTQAAAVLRIENLHHSAVDAVVEAAEARDSAALRQAATEHIAHIQRAFDAVLQEEGN